VNSDSIGLLGGHLSPVGWTVAFVRAPHDALVAADLSWRSGLGQHVEAAPAGPFPACLAALDPFEAPWTTELLVAGDGWTAYLNNGRDGGDPTSAATVLAQQLGVPCVVAMSSPLHGPGHGGTQLWVTGPDGEPPLGYVRTLAAVATDGRWAWHESGRALPFEDASRTGARRVRDRLDRDLLVTYLAALGIRVDDRGWFREATVVRQRVAWETHPETVADAARRLRLA
jgi:hypothetical protein